MSETFYLSLEDQRHTKLQGFKLSHGVKAALFERAGELQFKGHRAADGASYPISRIINEAITKYLGGEMAKDEENWRNVDPDDLQMFMIQLPVKLRDAIDREVNRRKSLRESGANITAVVRDAIEAYDKNDPIDLPKYVKFRGRDDCDNDSSSEQKPAHSSRLRPGT